MGAQGAACSVTRSAGCPAVLQCSLRTHCSDAMAADISPPPPGTLYVMEEQGGGGLRSCKVVAAALLGLLQFVCSGLVFGFEIFLIFKRAGMTGAGIWCGLLFFVTGIVTIAGACTSHVCALKAAMIVNLLSALSAVYILTFNSITASISHYSWCSYECLVSYIVQIVFAFVSLIASIVVIVINGQTVYGWCGGRGRLRPAQSQCVDPTRNPDSTLSQLNSWLPMFCSSDRGRVHCAAEERCSHLPRN